MIDEEVVKHVAELARLELTDDEVDSFAKELNEVVEHFEVLDELKTKTVDPSFHPIKTIDRLREDEAEEGLSKSEVLNLSPSTEDDYFKAPSIM